MAFGIEKNYVEMEKYVKKAVKIVSTGQLKRSEKISLKFAEIFE